MERNHHVHQNTAIDRPGAGGTFSESASDRNEETSRLSPFPKAVKQWVFVSAENEESIEIAVGFDPNTAN